VVSAPQHVGHRLGLRVGCAGRPADVDAPPSCHTFCASDPHHRRCTNM
jgi:hypothetical protein